MRDIRAPLLKSNSGAVKKVTADRQTVRYILNRWLTTRLSRRHYCGKVWHGVVT